ncbi:hypothetical protein [Haloferax sp. KTX1]|uniref:hypothetical protein n=1 Tax=Haloferax sp. KTX1 TaxID=2600597 RepID=UPI0011DDC737|nr:hypothetical protein [Haloferax sp. KTX1]
MSSQRISRNSRFMLIAVDEHRSRSLPPGTRLIAQAQRLEDLSSTIEAKTGDRGDDDGNP